MIISPLVLADTALLETLKKCWCKVNKELAWCGDNCVTTESSYKTRSYWQMAWLTRDLSFRWEHRHPIFLYPTSDALSFQPWSKSPRVGRTGRTEQCWYNKRPCNNPGWHPTGKPEIAVASQGENLSMKHQHHNWISNFHQNQGICMPEPVKTYKSQQQIHDLLSDKTKLGGTKTGGGK